MKKFGLIGYPLGHSFSKKYFTNKFEDLGLADHCYDLFELETIDGFPALWQSNRDLVGLNVTVPYKQAVIPFLDRLDESARKVGAVNTIMKEGQSIIGYNSDYFGFMVSLKNDFQDRPLGTKALVLGSGGASKAVAAALTDLGIDYAIVSRLADKGDYTYDQLNNEPSIVSSADIIVNTTPVGMYPNVDKAPAIPFDLIKLEHYVYDLVYNPEVTKLMSEASKRGARTKNGMEMLHLQADRSWEIWNSFV